jgi:hypothetical protein
MTSLLVAGRARAADTKILLDDEVVAMRRLGPTRSSGQRVRRARRGEEHRRWGTRSPSTSSRRPRVRGRHATGREDGRRGEPVRVVVDQHHVAKLPAALDPVDALKLRQRSGHGVEIDLPASGGEMQQDRRLGGFMPSPGIGELEGACPLEA